MKRLRKLFTGNEDSFFDKGEKVLIAILIVLVIVSVLLSS